MFPLFLSLTIMTAVAAGPPASAQQPEVETIGIEDLESGAGAEARKGKTLVVHYTGWFYDPAKDERGRKFDSSHGGTPLSFRLGDGLVIKGWDDGLTGMRVGGVRTLIVRPQPPMDARARGRCRPTAG